LPYVSSSHISLLCLTQSLSPSCTISLVAINFRDTVDFVKLGLFRLRQCLKPKGFFSRIRTWCCQFGFPLSSQKIRTYIHTQYIRPSMHTIRGRTINFANSPPYACCGSTEPKALVWFDNVDISALHRCVVVDLWQSLSEWHLLVSACVLACRRENIRV